MKNLMLLVLIVCVSVLVSGCASQSNQEIALEAGMSESEFTELDRTLRRDLGEEIYRVYKIKRMSKANNIELMQELFGDERILEGTTVWCLELIFKPVTQDDDYELYFAEGNKGYNTFTSGGGKSREEWWEEFRC